MIFSTFPRLSFWNSRRLPMLLQTEASECGLACLCMITSYWGHTIDLSSMRRRFSVSLKGINLKGLMAMARGVELESRPLKLEMSHLADLKLPCILHWNLNHFVVLKSVKANHAIIHDPSVGERKILLTQFAQHFTGVAVEFTPTVKFETRAEVQEFSLLSLMGRVIGLKQGLIQLLLLGVAMQVCALVAPFYMQWLVDEALLAADHDLITVLGSGFLLLAVIQTSIGAVRSWITTVLATNLNFQWFSNVFAHLLKLPLSYFEKRHTGDVISRFNSIQIMQQSLTIKFVEGVLDGILVIGTLVMMVLYSVSLSIIACSTVLIYIMLRWSIFSKLRSAKAEQIIHASKQQTHFLESIRGIQSIRLFGRTEERRASWMNTLADQFNAELRISKISVSYQTANTMLFAVERVVVIWLAALAVMNNQFSVGMMYAFISYKDQFSQRTSSLVDNLFELRMLRLHGERVADIVLSETEVDHLGFEVNTDEIIPSIECYNLSFRYSDNEPNVIDNLNLTIPAGQCIAITGPSGCGKTTLLKILLGLLQPTAGEIRIGGTCISQIGISNYRNLLGTVMQDDTLYAGSIADNICFFDSTVNFERIQTCARLSAIDSEILNMPMGFNTLVGDIGTGLSGGQKQRILLARALYKNPKILILDEATSHLDVRNEKAVNASISSIKLTRVIVAHRPETIGMAERVVVLHSGKISQEIFRPEAVEEID